MEHITLHDPVESDLSKVLLSRFWETHAQRAPTPTRGVNVAIYYLRSSAELTLEQLAARVSARPAVLANWEAAEHPVPIPSLQAFERVAREYGLVKLADYFENTALHAMYTRRQKKAKVRQI